MQRLSSGIFQHLEMRRNWRLRMSNQESKRKIRRDRESDPGGQMKKVFREERVIDYANKVK